MRKIVIILLAAVILLAASLVCACARSARPAVSAAPPEDAPEDDLEPVAEGQELLCLAKSRGEAESIAKTYGITLVSFSDGVAVFHTEEDPRAVIRRGKENGWTELSLNRVIEPL